MLCTLDYVIVLNRFSAHNIPGGGKWQNIPGRFCTEHSLRRTVRPAERLDLNWGRLDELLLAVRRDVKKPPGRLRIQLRLVSAKHPDVGHPHHMGRMLYMLLGPTMKDM